MFQRFSLSATAFLLAGLLACGGGKGQPPEPTRSYRMGFSSVPPRMDQAAAVAAIQLWSTRADAAIFHFEIPYKALLAGTSAADQIQAEHLTLAQYYRSQGLALWVTFDCTNGLDRSAESTELTGSGHSITEPHIQALFADYVKTFVELIEPDRVGLAAETNLIRLAAQPAVYSAMVAMTSATAAELRALHPTLPLYVTVQVDTAWGGLTGTGLYTGVEQDFTDFPFVDLLGLSSYPYLAGYARPADIPLDYYQRLRGGHPQPVFVAEGGWTSASFTSPAVTSSPERQAEYLARQGQLLDQAGAVAYFQLTFTDLDLASYPPQPSGSILPLFASNGVVDPDLNPKPALVVWDGLFARPLR